MVDEQTSFKLPEKEWSKLEEVAERWTRMTGQEVAANDVLHYGSSNWLEICAYRPTHLNKSYEPLDPALDPEMQTTLGELAKSDPYFQSYLESDESATPNTELCEFFELPTENNDGYRPWWVAPIFDVFDIWRTPLFALGIVDLRMIERNGKADVSDGCVGGFSFEMVEREPKEEPVNWITLKIEDLFVTNLEIHRFEQKHGIGQPTTQPAPMTGKLTPKAWKSLDPEQSREQARRRYQALGTYAAVGREAGVTGKRIEQLLKGNTPSINRKPPSDSSSAPAAWDTTNRATSKK